jgi:hypothetical protein
MQGSGRTKSGQVAQPNFVKSCEKADGREALSESPRISSISLKCNANNFLDPECFPIGIYDDLPEPAEAGFTTVLAEP